MLRPCRRTLHQLIDQAETTLTNCKDLETAGTGKTKNCLSWCIAASLFKTTLASMVMKNVVRRMDMFGVWAWWWLVFSFFFPALLGFSWNSLRMLYSTPSVSRSIGKSIGRTTTVEVRLERPNLSVKPIPSASKKWVLTFSPHLLMTFGSSFSSVWSSTSSFLEPNSGFNSSWIDLHNFIFDTFTCFEGCKAEDWPLWDEKKEGCTSNGR